MIIAVSQYLVEKAKIVMVNVLLVYIVELMRFGPSYNYTFTVAASDMLP